MLKFMLVLLFAACSHPAQKSYHAQKDHSYTTQLQVANKPRLPASLRRATRPIGGQVGTIGNAQLVATTQKYWRVTLMDDFKGKPANASSQEQFCYDQYKAQCHEWMGSSFDCARTVNNVQSRAYINPVRPNLEAAIRAEQPQLDLASMTLEEVLEKYDEIVSLNQKHLNKCLWTNYEDVNWMATDYNGKYSARFDPTQVKVNPSGKGFLELSAIKAPVTAECVLGGTKMGNECLLDNLNDTHIQAGVNYWVDADPRWPGIFYKKVNGGCPYGGTGSVNCQVKAFAPFFIEPGFNYVVKLSPQKGIYYPKDAMRCHHTKVFANNQMYRLPISCPILNGGLTSGHMNNRDGLLNKSGFSQKEGRFEVKLRIPKGRGAFPAAWLMPNTGGWPNRGGEIDVIEARDDANEVYQTYHHGKCYEKNTLNEVIQSPNYPQNSIDSAECQANSDWTHLHVHRGETIKQRVANEFQTRDHVFGAEWSGNKIEWFVNNYKSNVIEPGTGIDLEDPAQPGNSWDSAPEHLRKFGTHNLPTEPFYWILNHSTWVDPNWLASNNWPEQKVVIDYVKVYQQCKTQADFCPTGGTFEEGKGCKTNNGYVKSACESRVNLCPNGGVREGNRCVVQTLAQTLNAATNYWVDADVRWPGVYYKKINNSCPYGGSGSVNCQITALASDLLESGIEYQIDKTNRQIFYLPAYESSGTTGSGGTSYDVNKCPVGFVKVGAYQNKPMCKALTALKITTAKCASENGIKHNGYCLWAKDKYYKARIIKDDQPELKCPGLRPKVGEYQNKPVCQATPHFKIRESKCSSEGGSKWYSWCIWLKDNSWWRARHMK